METNEQIIKTIYANGWNPEYIKIEAVDGGIKVKGSFTFINWGEMKFQMHELGFEYDKERKIFVKTEG